MLKVPFIMVSIRVVFSLAHTQPSPVTVSYCCFILSPQPAAFYPASFPYLFFPLLPHVFPPPDGEHFHFLILLSMIMFCPQCFFVCHLYINSGIFFGNNLFLLIFPTMSEWVFTMSFFLQNVATVDAAAEASTLVHREV